MESDVADTRPRCYICNKPTAERMVQAGVMRKLVCVSCFLGIPDVDGAVDELVAVDFRNGYK